MSKAFDEVDGNLTDPCQHPDEKQARKLLFLGAIGAYKNPSSHREVEFDPEEAAEIIIIASHLLRIVDSCEGRTGERDGRVSKPAVLTHPRPTLCPILQRDDTRA